MTWFKCKGCGCNIKYKLFDYCSKCKNKEDAK